ncbi:hypothetical protein FXF50_19240 [Micromonospora sp. AP08]|uniref:hypothetical protein n=1 Tax=Micromonospora sp. AP08 TaxID=2604467 RepID=UPI0011D6D640|nr:hypothetical protein [Micromonospora sp. AP08]TYB36262.1 hypothetical protein FXF50_19240 [Micromonospora sp. AP08]
MGIIALVALSVSQVGCSGPFNCPEPEVTVDASVHTETAPIELELQPLGGVLEVHWLEWTESGRCDFSIGDLILLREGTARVAPADVARLTELTTAGAGNLPGDRAPDSRLSSWLPSAPRWRSGTGLDWRDGEEGSFVSVSYWLDPASGVVYFRSDADYDPVATPTASSS